MTPKNFLQEFLHSVNSRRSLEPKGSGSITEFSMEMDSNAADVALEHVQRFVTSASVSRIGFRIGRQNTPSKLETRRMCNTTTKPKNVNTF